MNKNNLLFLFALITICFVISIGFASANDNMTFKKELANNEFSNTIDKDVSSNVNSNIQSVSQNNSTLSNAKIDNKTSSSKEFCSFRSICWCNIYSTFLHSFSGS